MLLTAEWTPHVFKRRAISDCLARSLVRSEHRFFFFFFQSESGGPSVKALERPARSRKHKVITRLPFREQVPQTNSTEETEAFKVALHESPRFSGDSLEKLLFDQAIVNLCSGLWTCVFRLSQTDAEMFEHYHHHVPQLLHHLDFFPDR